MGRKKVHMEFILNNATSRNILWNAISTPSGLQGWFADGVSRKESEMTFRWGRSERRRAEITAMRTYSHIRFRWLDGEEVGEGEFFELRMTYSELTNDYMLEVTDFAEEDEEQDLRELWQSQIDRLRRNYGF